MTAAEPQREELPPPPVREKPSGLTMGRVVRFLPEDGSPELVGIVVDVLDDTGDVNLFVIARDMRDSIRGAYGAAAGLSFAHRVRYDPTGTTPRSWYFPARVP